MQFRLRCTVTIFTYAFAATAGWALATYLFDALCFVLPADEGATYLPIVALFGVLYLSGWRIWRMVTR